MLKCLVRTVLALMLVVTPATSFALSCMAQPFTLQHAYDTADAIIIAIVSDCEIPKSEDGWASGGDRCFLSTLEVLKSATPSRDYTVMANSAGCGLSYHVGHEYLLFLDESNKVMPYSMPLQRDTKDIDLQGRYIDLLRERRSGRITDLPEPWFYSENEYSCSLFQSVGSSRIVFETTYLFRPRPGQDDWQLSEQDGEWVYRRIETPADPNGRRPAQSVAVSSTLPDLPDQKHALRVHFNDTRPAPNRLSVFSTDGDSWPLHQTRVRNYLGDRLAHEFVHYDASESVALAVLDRFDAATDFKATALIVASSESSHETDSLQFGSTRTPETLLRVDSKSDRIGPALKRYRECLDRLDDAKDDATR